MSEPSATLHAAHGFWLEEAGPPAPCPALADDRTADVVVVGGGYTGLWTAWELAQHIAPERIVVLEGDRCGHGPSGRNGGFVDSHWRSVPELRRRFGADPALAFARAAADSVDAIGAWCDAEGVDAWFHKAGHLRAATAHAQEPALRETAAVCAELGATDDLHWVDGAAARAHCDSPLFRGGTFMPACATVQPARLALGLRDRLLARGVAIHERTRVRGLRAWDAGVEAETAGGRVRARHAVLAVNAATVQVPPLRRRLTVASSHIVLTEPVPEVVEQLGWTGGEAVTDGRVFLHYTRTTPDGRILFGWGGGRLAVGGRLRGHVEVDRLVVATAKASLLRHFPALAERRVRITHAWGGPIDVSPTHLPVFGTLPDGRVSYAFGYTGNGVGPSHLGGRILAALALDRRDAVTRLPVVEPPAIGVPPEPLRWVGGSLVRTAFLRKEAAEVEGRDPDPVTDFVTSIPGRLGIHLGRT